MTFNVEVKDRVANLTSIVEDGVATEEGSVGGNKGDIVLLELDNEWLSLMAETELKAAFVWKGKYYVSQIKEGSDGKIYCEVPPIFDSNKFLFGIYAGEDINDSPYNATTPIEMPCRLSIRDYIISPQDNYGKNYTDLALEAADSAKKAAERAEEAAEQAASGGGMKEVGSVTINIDAYLYEDDSQYVFVGSYGEDSFLSSDEITNARAYINDSEYQALRNLFNNSKIVTVEMTDTLDMGDYDSVKFIPDGMMDGFYVYKNEDYEDAGVLVIPNIITRSITNKLSNYGSYERETFTFTFKGYN